MDAIFAIERRAFIFFFVVVARRRKKREKTRASSSSANVGTLLGSFAGAFIRAMLTDEQLVGWGWRLPFLSGILIAFVSMYLEAHGREHNPNGGVGERGGGGGGGCDDEPGAEGRGESKHPFGEVFRRENLPALASATLTPMLYGAGFYTS